MATSAVDICNSALNMIGASNIISLDEDSKAGRICKQRYTNVRDAVFRSHVWNCLVNRVQLTADVSAPTFEFQYQYTLPTDPYCLRVIKLEFLDTVYRIEGRKLLTNESQLKLIYVGRDENVSNYDQLLSESIAAGMASDLAYPLVGSNTLAQQMFDMYQRKLSEARFVDATEGTPAQTENLQNAGQVQADYFLLSRF
tara:strand:+ start:12859 stop:13452 length:594 start_codon:yes stop_codon:yes gene_type:complete